MSNRLIEIGDDTLALDAAGNTIADHHGQRTFTYGPAGRLMAVHDGHHLIARYRYNAFGERVEKRTDTGITLYHYDVYGRLLGETNAEGVARRDYVWRDGIPVAQIDRTGPGMSGASRTDRDAGEESHSPAGPDRLVYLHTDGQGTPHVATDTNQTVVWRWEGEAFGASAPIGADVENHRHNDAGHGDDDHQALSQLRVTVNLRYPGQYYDRETGFFYNWERYYNPGTRRYVTSDPMGLAGGLNTYGYVGGNLLKWVDPTGFSGYSGSAAIPPVRPYGPPVPPIVIAELNNYANQAGAAGGLAITYGAATGDLPLASAGLMVAGSGAVASGLAQLLSPDLPGTLVGAGIDIATSYLPPPYDTLTDSLGNQLANDLLPGFLQQLGIGPCE